MSRPASGDSSTTSGGSTFSATRSFRATSSSRPHLSWGGPAPRSPATADGDRCCSRWRIFAGSTGRRSPPTSHSRGPRRSCRPSCGARPRPSGSSRSGSITRCSRTAAWSSGKPTRTPAYRPGATAACRSSGAPGPESSASTPQPPRSSAASSMIRSISVAPPNAAELAAELLESDRSYFESAAVLESVGGAVVARVPGLERVPAGCVVHRVDPSVLPRDPARWIELVEQRLLGHGCRRARFYLTGRHPGLEAALLARGYRPLDETGYALAVTHRPLDPPETPPADLRPVTTPDDWAAKLALHRLAAVLNGQDADPEASVELERVRAAVGSLR